MRSLSTQRPLPFIAAEDSMPEIIAIETGDCKIEAGEPSADGGEVLPKLSMNVYNGGIIKVAGYPRRMVIDLAGMTIPASNPVYRNHSSERIVGHGTTTNDGKSLHLTGVVSSDSQDAQDVVKLGKRGYPLQSSVGAQPFKIEAIKTGESVVVNGQTFYGPLDVVRKSKLREASVVDHGADDTTSTKIAASSTPTRKELPVNFSAWLKAKGFIEAELSEGTLATLKAMYDAEQKDDEKDKSPTVEAMLAAARKKEERQVEYGRIIQAALEKGMDADEAEKLVEAAINEDLDPVKFELAVLRASRNSGPMIMSTSRSSAHSGEMIEAALVRSMGDSDVQESYKPEVLEASEKAFKHGLSVVELLQLSARRNGYHNISHRDLRGLLRAAFAPVEAKGPSTYDVGGLLSNVMNKSILAGFENVESAWKKLSAIRPVNDLKEHTSYRLTESMEFERVGPGGEIRHGTWSEEKYSNKAETYAKIAAITRSDLINDSLDAFSRLKRNLGRGGALAFNKVFWTEFLADLATFYTAARKNLMTGASSALDVDSLSKALTQFSDQVDKDGNPLGMVAALLVVPNALGIQGNRLNKDTSIAIAGSTDRTELTSNPNAGKLKDVVVSAYLNNAVIPGGAPEQWFLAADPNDVPLIESCFLYGNQTPQVDSAEADFDTLGVQARAFWDFGVAKQDFRAGLRAVGK